MKKGAKKTAEKYVTERTFNTFEDRFDKFENRFDASMRAVAKSFSDNAEVTAGILTQLKNINEVSTIMLQEIRTIHEDNKYFRQSMSDLNIENVSRDRKIQGLDVRVEKLESK